MHHRTLACLCLCSVLDYGDKFALAGTTPIAQLTPAQRAANATALAHATLCLCVPAWLICVACYGCLIYTYPRDKRKVLGAEARGRGRATPLLEEEPRAQ